MAHLVLMEQGDFDALCILKSSNMGKIGLRKFVDETYQQWTDEDSDEFFSTYLFERLPSDVDVIYPVDSYAV